MVTIHGTDLHLSLGRLRYLLVLAFFSFCLPGLLRGQETFQPLDQGTPTLSQHQIDAILKGRVQASSGMSGWLGKLWSGKTAGPTGFSPAWLQLLAGMGGKNGAGGGGDFSQLLEALKGSGNAIDSATIQRLMRGLGGGGSPVGLSPMEMGQWVPLFQQLIKNKDLLQALHPDLDWTSMSALFSRLQGQVGVGVSSGDLIALKSLLETITKPGAGTPFGLGDMCQMMGLLDRINTGTAGAGELGQAMQKMPSAGTVLQRMGINPEQLGKLGEFLRRVGMNAQQVRQMSEWLSRVPAPGMKENLGKWLAGFDWDKLSPGKWQGLFPRWTLPWIERMKVNFSFLKGIKWPSFRINAPSISLPKPSMPTMPAISIPDRQTLAWIAGGFAGLVLLVFVYIYLVKLGLAPDIIRGFKQPDAWITVDSLERFKLIYEDMALDLLGQPAWSYHHRKLAHGLEGVFPSRVAQVSFLDDLYERSRYLPESMRPTGEQAEEGILSLAVLAQELDRQRLQLRPIGWAFWRFGR